MQNESPLSPLFSSLKSENPEIRSNAERHVFEMLEAQNISFIEQIIKEMIQPESSINQICYSFIILNKSYSFFKNYSLVIETTFHFFSNEDERILNFASNTYAIFSLELFKSLNDRSSIERLLVLLQTTDDPNILASSITSLMTIIMNLPSSSNLFLELCQFIFSSFINSESEILLIGFIRAINSILSSIPVEFVSENAFMNKLLALLLSENHKYDGYLLLDTILDNFYSNGIFQDFIIQIAQLSCNELVDPSKPSLIMRILYFWEKIGNIESIEHQDSIIFHYVATVGPFLVPSLLQVLLIKYEGIDDESYGNAPYHESLSTIRQFVKCCPDAFSPLLFEFIQQAFDLKASLMILSILAKYTTLPFEIEHLTVFFTTISSSLASPDSEIRFAALSALKSFSLKEYIPNEILFQFIELITKGFLDIEKNAIKSFRIFVNIVSRLTVEEQTQNIIEFLQNIQLIPINYISPFFNFLEDNISQIVKSHETVWILNLIDAFTFLFELELEQIHQYTDSIICSIIYILIKFFNQQDELPLTQSFPRILNCLLRSLQELKTWNAPQCIVDLMVSDKISADAHIESISELFVTILNQVEDLNNILTLSLVSSLSRMYLMMESVEKTSNIYQCLCNILVKVNLENVLLVQELFRFFAPDLIIHPLATEVVQKLFDIIKFYLTFDELHQFVYQNQTLFEDICDFIDHFMHEYLQSFSPQYFEIAIMMLSVLGSMNNIKPQLEESVLNLLEDLNSHFPDAINTLVQGNEILQALYCRITPNSEKNRIGI